MRRWVTGRGLRICLATVMVLVGMAIGGSVGSPIALADSLILSPSQGPPGIAVGITWNDTDSPVVDNPGITDTVFFDSTPVGTFTTNAQESFSGVITIPSMATAGAHTITVVQNVPNDDEAPPTATFTVTGAGVACTGQNVNQACAAIWTDRSTYQAGDTVQVCFSVPTTGAVSISETVPGGASSVIFQQSASSGGCFFIQALPPYGTHTLTLSFAGGVPNSLVFTATTSFSVVPNPAAPAGLWVSPDNNSTAAPTVQLAAHAYPGTVYSYPVASVQFTAWWPTLGSQTAVPGQVLCTVTTPSSDATYSCTVDLSKLGIPAGQVVLGFDVIDTAGHVRINPNETRTITYVPPSPTATPVPPTATPTPLPPTATPTSTPTSMPSPTPAATSVVQNVVNLFPPFDHCATSKSHHKSPAKHASNLLAVGFSAASVSCHAADGTFGLKALAFGGKTTASKPKQTAQSSSAIAVSFTPTFSGILGIRVKLTLHGKAGSAAGPGLASRVRYRDGIGKSLLSWLTQSQLTNLLGTVRHLSKPTGASTSIMVFVRVTGAAGRAQKKLKAPAASFPLPPSSSGRSYAGKNKILSTQVSVTAGHPITITVGAKGFARSRGPAAAIVNLKRCSVDLITLSKK